MNKSRIRITHEALSTSFNKVLGIIDLQHYVMYLMDESREYRKKFTDLYNKQHNVRTDSSTSKSRTTCTVFKHNPINSY